MQNRILPLAAALVALSLSPLYAQQPKDWRQQPLEYRHSVTLEVSTGISSKDGELITAHPIIRRLSAMPNVADLKIAGTLNGGSLKVTFGFRTVEAFNEWNESPATKELLTELKRLSPTGVQVSLAMNPGVLEK